MVGWPLLLATVVGCGWGQAVVISTVLSIYIKEFDFHPTLMLLVGGSIVMVATAIYTTNPQCGSIAKDQQQQQQQQRRRRRRRRRGGQQHFARRRRAPQDDTDGDVL